MPKDIGSVLQSEDGGAEQNRVGQVVQAEQEGCGDAEIAAAASKPPEEVGVALLARRNQLALCGHQDPGASLVPLG